MYLVRIEFFEQVLVFCSCTGDLNMLIKYCVNNCDYLVLLLENSIYFLSILC